MSRSDVPVPGRMIGSGWAFVVFRGGETERLQFAREGPTKGK